jgi:hypothetical protein
VILDGDKRDSVIIGGLPRMAVEAVLDAGHDLPHRCINNGWAVDRKRESGHLWVPVWVKLVAVTHGGDWKLGTEELHEYRRTLLAFASRQGQEYWDALDAVAATNPDAVAQFVIDSMEAQA